jgi:RNA polymerase sigma factor (sigma-70 family)
MNNPRSEPLPLGQRILSRRTLVTHPHAVKKASARSAGPAATSRMTDEARFLAALPTIDDVVGRVCRRHHLSAAEADELRSDVRMHFIDRNYEVLRRFEGRSSLTTYVTVVIQRVLLERRNRLWGKWRPTADARRHGPTGILLERLVTRDGWTLEQALEMLRVNHGVTIDDTLQAFCDRLSTRGPSRQLVSEDDAGDVVSQGPATDANVLRAEQDFLAKRVQSALERARQTLEPMERLILKMRFEDRVAVVDIARALHLDQRRLYRTIERLLSTIGASMAADGISRADVVSLFAEGDRSWSQGRDDVENGAAELRVEEKRSSWLSR